MDNEEQDVEDAVDEIVETAETEARRLGLSTEEFFDRIIVEMKTRAEG